MSEEDFETGRMIGLVARKDKALYERVRAVAKTRKKKMQDVITEALDLWYLYQTMEGVDPRALSVAIAFVEHMLDRATRILVQLGQVFTSEFVKTSLELMASPPSQQSPQQEQQKTDVAETMRTQVMSTLMPMVMNLLQTLVASMVKTPLPQTQAPPLTARQVKVEE